MLRPVISCLFEYWHVPWGRGNDKYPPICFNVKNHFHNNNNNNQISCFITFFKSIIVFCGTGDILKNIPHIPHICIPMFLSLIHHMLSLEHKILSKCLKKGSLLSTIGGGSTYWHLYQFQGTSQAIDVKNVNWLWIATFSLNCPLLCCVVLWSKFVVLC